MATTATEVQSLIIPSALMAEVKNLARAQERSVDEVLLSAVKNYVGSTQRWERLKAYGRGQAQKLGYTEDDVERLIAESRQELGPIEFRSPQP
ncbi:hypothetical protein [Terracidiphilus gabretensis]|uniref:hypothetical protein n=1 Tax=Terracidiphilus gabretensis TaxID=1577687 RepID=UPI00071B37FE|nr:hypothetical protein [Terracidiphilus gabretensis]